MDEKTKRCHGCGTPIRRRYFTMVDEKGEDVYLCPYCGAEMINGGEDWRW